MLTLVIQDGVVTAAEVGLDQPPVLADQQEAVLRANGLLRPSEEAELAAAANSNSEPAA